MLLQTHEGLSDREACDRLAFDLRWKAAAGLAVGSESFHPTVLVGMRNRLRGSERPRRLLEDVNAVARQAGLLRGRRRVLDSTPLYDAVATQDTVIQLRAAIRKLLTAADRDAAALAAAVRAALARDDDYATLGKPPCDWDDPVAREALVDALVRDCQAALAVLHGQTLGGPLVEAAELLALVAGQDVEAGEDGGFRIARRVARDRVISTVDTGARHGHKSRARTVDGYKTHLNVDPDDELITNVTVTSANTPDREVIDELLDEPVEATNADSGLADPGDSDAGSTETAGFEVYGDSAYADGQTLAEQAERGNDLRAKVPPVRNPRGYSKDQFRIDPRHRHGDLPRRAHRAHPPAAPRRTGPLRPAVHQLPAARRVHHSPLRAGDQHSPPRGHAAASQSPSTRPGLAAGLPGAPTSSGTQDQPLRAQTLGRTQGPMPRASPHPHRRPHPGRRDQPRPPRHPRSAPRTQRLGHRLTPAPTSRQARPAPRADASGQHA